MQKKQKIKDNPIAPRVCPANATDLLTSQRGFHSINYKLLNNYP